MREFTIHVDSDPDALTGDENAAAERLVAFHDALIADPRALGPAAGLENPTGVIGATFQVTASRQDEAERIAGDTFNDALGRAGIESRWHRIESDDEPFA